MIKYDNVRETVVKGLKQYLGCPVIRSNQNVEPPKYPYVSYTVTTLVNENKGTYGEYDDGMDRKQLKQTWSITVQSDVSSESAKLACKAREWLDHVGTRYLNDNDVVVERVTSVANRDNIISVEYEYKNGFDVVFVLFDEAERPNSDYIENVEMNEEVI